jgi:hypothetical protein
MPSRDVIIQIAAASVFVAGMGAAASLSGSIAASSSRAQLTYTDQATEGDPPEVALGIAMGAFRGLFVNFLWIRANQLKEEGKFYEAIELSSAITRLQPRFPRVWAFHAWNMAYNISVATNTASERWQWVNAGINLLRSEGIPRNPNDVTLHRELAWTYLHKIQGYADDANHYYKREVAREWTIALGEPPSMQGSSEQNRETMAQWLQPLVDAPDTLDGVIARELEDQEKRGVQPGPGGERVSQVRALVDRIEKEANLRLDRNFLRLVELRRAWLNAWYIAEKGFERDLREGDRNAVLDALMQDAQFEDAWPRLLSFVRRRVLIEDYNMEPERMQRYTRRFGPMDWRHPATHAIYWAYRGVEEGLERAGVSQFDTLNTDRIVMHAIQELARYGQINYDFLTNDYFTLTNYDWIDPYGDVMTELAKRGGIATDTEQRIFTLYGAGYENFMKDVIRTYYSRGDIANAEKYHRILRTWTGLNLNDSSMIERLKLPLAEFVQEEIKDRLTTPYVALQEIEAALTDAYLRGLGERKPQVFASRMEYARKLRDAYLQTQNVKTFADPETIRMKEYVGENFATMAARVLLRLLAGGSFGEYRLGPTQAGALYRRTPLQIQQLIYDDLRALATRGNSGISPELFNELYPEPPGMEQYRAALEALESESDRARRREIQFEIDANRKQ